MFFFCLHFWPLPLFTAVAGHRGEFARRFRCSHFSIPYKSTLGDFDFKWWPIHHVLCAAALHMVCALTHVSTLTVPL